MPSDDLKVKFETLRTMDQTADSMDTIENHMSEHVRVCPHIFCGHISDRTYELFF